VLFRENIAANYRNHTKLVNAIEKCKVHFNVEGGGTSLPLSFEPMVGKLLVVAGQTGKK
jgi:hypothetical protein